jgi:hypothetical protein
VNLLKTKEIVGLYVKVWVSKLAVNLLTRCSAYALLKEDIVV